MPIRQTLIARPILLVASLLLVIWITQLRYPPLSYPALGQTLVIILAGTALMIFTKLQRSPTAESVSYRHPAMLPGFLFILWIIIRWAMNGFTALGSEEIGTFLWMAVYMLSTYGLALTVRRNSGNDGNVQLSQWFLMVLAVLGLMSGLHAVWQYHVSYQQSYQTMMASIGDRKPDLLELGILEHLKLRRVAGVFGDPNNLATFSALAFCASIELLTLGRRLKILGALTFLPSLAAVYYSGSRGGVLDIIGIVALYFLLLTWQQFRNRGSARPKLTILLAAGILLFTATKASLAQDSPDPAPEKSVSGVSNWKWRSDSVRERVYYLEVGARMMQMAPLTGLGLGSVDQYFGRLKSPEARETKYLHNWIIQTGAEYGLMGISLAFWFLTAILIPAIRQGLLTQAISRCFVIMILMLIFDALIQITWNQRELMSTFGIICGLTMASSSRQVAPSRLATWRSGTIFLLLGLFAISEVSHLGGKASKSLALDYAYAADQAQSDKYWQKASRWVPNDPEPYSARASNALQNGRFTQARTLMDQALKYNPESASLHILASEIHSALHQKNKAVQHLTVALKLYPTKADYNYKKAKVLATDGDTTRALEFARLAAKYNYYPDMTATYDQLVTDLQQSLSKPND